MQFAAAAAASVASPRLMQSFRKAIAAPYLAASAGVTSSGRRSTPHSRSMSRGSAVEWCDRRDPRRSPMMLRRGSAGGRISSHGGGEVGSCASPFRQMLCGHLWGVDTSLHAKCWMTHPLRVNPLPPQPAILWPNGIWTLRRHPCSVLLQSCSALGASEAALCGRMDFALPWRLFPHSGPIIRASICQRISFSPYALQRNSTLLYCTATSGLSLHTSGSLITERAKAQTQQ